MNNKAKVLDWIKDNFVINEILISDFPLFPSGQLIKDKTGNQMVVYWCISYNRIETAIPDGRREDNANSKKYQHPIYGQAFQL